MIFETVYNAKLLDAKQQHENGGEKVVTDKLPAGTLDGIAILSIKAVLSQEPLTDRFKGRQGVFNRASNK